METEKKIVTKEETNHNPDGTRHSHVFNPPTPWEARRGIFRTWAQSSEITLQVYALRVAGTDCLVQPSLSLHESPSWVRYHRFGTLDAKMSVEIMC